MRGWKRRRIRRLAGTSAITRDDAEPEDAWARLRALGAAVVPYLAAEYPGARRYQGRVRLVFHGIPFARVSDAAFGLGVASLEDRVSALSESTLQEAATGRSFFVILCRVPHSAGCPYVANRRR